MMPNQIRSICRALAIGITRGSVISMIEELSRNGAEEDQHQHVEGEEAVDAEIDADNPLGQEGRQGPTTPACANTSSQR